MLNLSMQPRLPQNLSLLIVYLINKSTMEGSKLCQEEMDMQWFPCRIWKPLASVYWIIAFPMIVARDRFVGERGWDLMARKRMSGFGDRKQPT